jgi:hypothetical protein
MSFKLKILVRVKELDGWLGPQVHKMKSPVTLFENFAAELNAQSQSKIVVRLSRVLPSHTCFQLNLSPYTI